jgi:hypothetical protein
MRSLEVHLVPGLTPRPTDDHLGHWHPTPGEPFLPLLRTNDCHALVVTGWNERGPDFGEGPEQELWPGRQGQAEN